MTSTVRGPLSVDSLMPAQIDDERRFLLASAPFYIFRQHLDNRTLYSILMDAPLDRRGLMDLLFTVAPYKAHGPDRFSRVLDNWALFDRAKTSATSESLMLEHAKSLRFSWQEFERHRDAFSGVLHGQTQSVLPLIAWSNTALGRRRWEFSAPDPELLREIQEVRPGTTGEQLDTLVGLVAIPYLLPELCSKWRAWRPLVKGGKSNYIGPASVPVMALLNRQALLKSALIQRAEAYVAERTL